MYRFSIHKVIIIENQGDIPFAEWQKLDVDEYSFERYVYPVWDDLAIDIKKEKERIFFRDYMDGIIRFVNNTDKGIYDFRWFNEIRLDAAKRYVPRILVIEQKNNGVYEVIHRCLIPVFKGNFNLDECYVEFENLEPIDRYSPLLTITNKQFNVIDVESYDVIFETGQYDYEQKIVSYYLQFDDYQAPVDWIPQGLVVLGEEYWTLYQSLVTYAGKRPDLTGVYKYTYYVKKIYRRDVYYGSSNPNGWYDAGSNVPSGYPSDTHKYIRTYLNGEYGNYLMRVLVPGNTNWSIIIYLEVPDFENPVENNRARLMVEVIRHIISNVGLTFWPVQSSFVYGTVNPVTGEENRLTFLMLIQKTDFYETTDHATKAMITFKDIEDIWKNMFNAYWDITEDGDFRIEHKSFYENGGSYSGSKSVGINLLADTERKKQTYKMNKFSFEESELFRREHWEMGEAGEVDFIGMDIEYDVFATSTQENNIREFSTVFITTDIFFAWYNPDKIGKDGFIMLACYVDDEDGLFYSYSEWGILTGMKTYNGHLAISMLQDKYFRHDRVLPSGKMNGQQTEFESWHKTMIQDDLTFNFCRYNDFDPIKLVKTAYGEGEIISASYKLKTRQLTVKLKYHA